MNEEQDWIVIGGGIAGISIAEILSRNGKKVKIIEKEKKLSPETSREFHEWVHTGSLYSLHKNQEHIQKTMLGAIDDMLHYYSAFKNMNLKPTSQGLKIDSDTQDIKWFNSDYIHFKYRIKNRKFDFSWLSRIVKSILSIEKIALHNWLRYRGGEISFKFSFLDYLINLIKVIKFNQKMYTLKSNDFTSNSRVILNDLYENAIKRGLTVSFENEFISYDISNEKILVNCKNQNFICKNLVFCNGKNISKVFSSKIKTSYAPMLVTKNVPSQQKPYVELDKFEMNCINYLGKNDGIGLMGGISFQDKKQCDSYFNKLAAKLIKMWPEAEVKKKYIGEKHELVPNDSPRNYQFFIWNKKDTNIWAVIPGKFSLFPSFATEFYRRVYDENSKNIFDDLSSNRINNKEISDTVWGDFTKAN